MALLLSIGGIVVFLFLKYVIYKPDEPAELCKNALSALVDLSLMGFMLCLSAISQLQQPTDHAPHVLLGSVFLIAISIYFWKLSCLEINSNRIGVTFNNKIRFFIFTFFNVIIAIASIFVPIQFLGAAWK